jgi:hypothetical protein
MIEKINRKNLDYVNKTLVKIFKKVAESATYLKESNKN